MDTPKQPPLPTSDPVEVPDVAAEPHPGVDAPAAGTVSLPQVHPGLADAPGVEEGFKPLPELAKPEEETEG